MITDVIADWATRADELEDAETRLLDALAIGDQEAISAAEENLADVLRRSARLRRPEGAERDGSETVPVGSS